MSPAYRTFPLGRPPYLAPRLPDTPERRPRYFCTCFLCGSDRVCIHREPELVLWWRQQQRQERAS